MSHINETTHLEMINGLTVAVKMIDDTASESGMPIPYERLAARNKLAELAAMARREAKLAGLLVHEMPGVRG
jgi:hypothetical protein